MPALGFRIQKQGGSYAFTGVVLADDKLTVLASIYHLCDGAHSQAQQARELRDWLNSTLTAYPDVTAALLFEGDYSPQQRLADTVRLRHRLEGAALSAALDRIPLVEIRNGRQLGSLIGESKAILLDRASALALPASHVDAGAAAIACLHLS